MTEEQPTGSGEDDDGRLHLPDYGNQWNLFEVHCRSHATAARYAGTQSWWLHCWTWIPDDRDEPLVVVVGEPDPPWPAANAEGSRTAKDG